MKRMLIVAVLGIFVTTGLCDDPPPVVRLEPPDIPMAPLQLEAAMARMNKKGQVVLRMWSSRTVAVTATRILRDGKEVKEKHECYENVFGWEDRVYDTKNLVLLGSDGKPLDKKMLPELLKKERPVLYGLQSPYKISEAFLKIIKEGTPILLLPLPPLPTYSGNPG